MEQREFGRTGMKVSMLGFGGAEIGRGTDALAVDKLLGSALDAGLNVIDTAECYGESEELIGRVLAHRRQDYYLFTKCGHASGMELDDWEPKLLEKTIDRSLQRLQTDYVDVIHLHSCSEEILRQGDVIGVLQRAKEKGKTRFIGYSGDSTAAVYAIATGVFDSFETSLNIADQEAVELTIPEAKKKGMGIIAKRPVANVAWTKENVDRNDYAYSYWKRLQELEYEFLRDDVSVSVSQALRFTLTVPGVDTAIVGTQNPDRWRQNAALLEKGLLSAEEYRAIRQRWHEIAKSDWIGLT
ncbi:aldo/keto reductase [Paenibacillus sp. CAA11]|uniref:aldo/keto reductase n=1 Tax=Paenibacillus sp. CAA11 TaxID=1532905 RepID=UPI000D33E774|nr:aldo/keto reductase [Paenibacillus sp. CAA11]AWB44812.1 aldo/keto reductase [Paenibacillus sp. CAA11]